MALTKPMQQARTLTPNNPPANGTLREGQLSVEYDPPRLWVGGPGGTVNIQLSGPTAHFAIGEDGTITLSPAAAASLRAALGI